MMFIKPEFYHVFSALLSETETAKMISARTPFYKKILYLLLFQIRSGVLATRSLQSPLSIRYQKKPPAKPVVFSSDIVSVMETGIT